MLESGREAKFATELMEVAAMMTRTMATMEVRLRMFSARVKMRVGRPGGRRGRILGKVLVVMFDACEQT